MRRLVRGVRTVENLACFLPQAHRIYIASAELVVPMTMLLISQHCWFTEKSVITRVMVRKDLRNI
jgi:hypothetical protein